MLADALRMGVGVAGTVLYLSLWNLAVSRLTGTRRRLAQIAFLLLVTPYLLLLFWLMERVAASAAASPDADLTPWVDPRIGTDTDYERSRGNTYPAAARPGGMTAWAPQTGGYDSNLFYRFRADTLTGLRATHQASVWLGDYGDFSLMPVVGRPGFLAHERGSRYRHEAELARPEAYAVALDDYGLRFEVAPSMRGAVLRVSSEASDTVTFIVDPHPPNTRVDIAPDGRRLRALTLTRIAGVPDNFASHLALAFDRSAIAVGTFTDSTATAGQTRSQGDHSGAYLTFAGVRREPLVVRAGTSFLTADYAERALEREIGGASFEAVAQQGRREWNELLGRVRVEGASDSQRTVLYTALYHCLLFPRTWHEVDPQGQPVHYSPYDGRVRAGPLFADFGLWDTYRTLFPLLTLVYPERVAPVLEGLLNACREGGRFPKWPAPGYREGMPGTQAEAVFADAWSKGVRGFDLDAAYEGLRRDGTEPGGALTGRLGLAAYDSLGYVPADRYPGATSLTLEFAYGDFCLATLARAAGRAADAERFAARSASWRHVFDPVSGFARGRETDGGWQEPFDPFAWGDPFVEGNAWHYTWAVPHDVAGLVAAMGGPAAFAARLDSFFAAPATYRTGSYGRVIHEMRELADAGTGQYGHGNQPGHHIPYLYNAAGQPWKTQALVRGLVDRHYRAAPDGLAGDEDTGSLSSWYLFSVLGFYPLCPGRPAYTLGAPRFDEAILQLPGGRTLTVEANGALPPERRYVQAVRWNGTAVREPWIAHADLAAGGTLTFEMGTGPNREWFTSVGDEEW